MPAPDGGRRTVMSRKHGLGATAVVGLAVVLAGCASDSPTEPDQLSAQASAAPSAQIAAARPNVAGVALDDASTRLVASLGDAVARAQLQAHLRDLSSSLDAGDDVKARRALGLARKALAKAESKGEAADLAAIGLALDQAEQMLSEAGSTESSSTESTPEAP